MNGRVTAAAILWVVTCASSPARAHDRPFAHDHDEATDAEGSVYASVEIDTSGIADAGPSMQKRIQERAGLVMHESGILPSRNRDDAVVRVDVDDLDGEVVGYTYEVWVERRGKVVGDRARKQCQACSETELLDATVGAIEHALAGLEPDEAGAADGDGSPTVLEEPDDSTESAQPDHDRQPMSAMGKAGIGVLAGGVVILGVGVGLAAPKPKPLQDNPLQVKSFRPPGFALIGVGAAAAVTGAVLLVLDRKRTRGSAIAPTISPTMTGITWTGRF